jgi:PAS domain S-box-containing protein
MKSTVIKSKAAILRQKVELLQKIIPTTSDTGTAFADVLKLVHELEAFHAEQECQNEKILSPISTAQEKKHGNYEALINSTSDLMWSLDNKYNFIAGNAAFIQHIFDNSGLEITPGDNLFSRTHFSDEYLQYWKKIYDKCLEGEIVVTEVYSPSVQNSAGKWYEIILHPISADGEIAGATCFGRDISKSKRVGLALRESEERYRSLIEQASDFIVITDLDGNFIDVNSNFCKTFGYSKNDLTQRNVTMVLDPEQIKSEPFRFDLVKNGESVLRERRMVDRNGNIIEVETITKMLPDGSVLAIGRDIGTRKKAEQEKKASEEKYRTLVEQAVDAIVLYNASGKILDVNTGSVNFIGYEKDELLKMYVYDILTKEESTAKPIQYEVLQKGVSTVKQRMMRRKDGATILTEVRSQQLPDGLFLSVIRDLTERVKAQEQIQKEKDLSDSIINSLPGIFYLYDESGNLIRWNNNLEQVTGYSNHEISRMNAISFFDTNQQNDIRRSKKMVLENEILGTEVEILTKNKNKIPFYINSIAIDYEGKKCLMGIGIDISARKKADQALKSSVSSLDASLESTADGILIVNCEGKITKWNQKFVNIWKMDERILSSNDDSLAIKFILSMLTDPEHFLDKVRYLYKHPDESSFDQINFRDGRIFERYSQSQKIEGIIVGRVWSFRDITERKQAEAALLESEEKYRTIFDNVQDVFFQTDLNGVVLEISPSIKYFIDFDRDEILGKTFSDYYFNPNDRIILLNTVIQYGEVRDYEIKIKTKSGTIMYTTISSRLIFDQNGNPNHITGAIRDITERKKNELEIANQHKQLQLQNKELEQFTYITSHDLQEPLRNLISIVGLMKEEYNGKLDENAEQYLNYITQSSARMQDLVRELSAYSRIGKEKKLTTVDCYKIVHEALSDMSVAIKESGARITVQELPKLNGYSTELRQLFQNLISNALKFRKKDVIAEIVVSAKKQEDNWFFSIQDNGIGIPEKDKEKIFIIFKRLHNRNDYEGTGIGLSHCKKIVELHGGNIWVDSKPGTGSIFNFTLNNL